MAKVPEKLTLNVSNIPAVDADSISHAEWEWLKVQHPDNYAEAQNAIKAHAKALAAQAPVADAVPAAAPAAPAVADKKAKEAVSGN